MQNPKKIVVIKFHDTMLMKEFPKICELILMFEALLANRRMEELGKSNLMESKVNLNIVWVVLMLLAFF